MTSPREIVFPEDPSKFKTWARTHGADVVRALEKCGCFMAKDNKLEGCHKTLKKKLPDLVNALGQHESFDIPEATTDEGINTFITTYGNNDMRETILGYTRTAAELGAKVTEIVLEHYQLPQESTGYIFRMTRYMRGAVNLGFSNQNDRVEFLAVLDLNQVDGLEMKVDNQWVKIDVKPSTFLIMAGRPLKDWREGKIHRPELRVNMHGNEKRYSVGLFSYYDNKGKNDEGRIDKGKIDKGKNDEGRIDKGKIDKGKIDKGKNDEGRIDKGKIDKGKGKIDKGKNDEGRIDKGKIDKGKIDKGRIDKVKTEAPKEQVEHSRRS